MQDARRAEAEAVAGTYKTMIRAGYAKDGKISAETIEEINSAKNEHIQSVSFEVLDARTVVVRVEMREASDGILDYTFDIKTGVGKFVWHDDSGGA